MRPRWLRRWATNTTRNGTAPGGVPTVSLIAPRRSSGASTPGWWVGPKPAAFLCDLPQGGRIECLLPLANVLASLHEVGFIGGLTSISRAILRALFIQLGP